ncbi:o-succinylbenzoate synthase [Vibrio nigripulchritudo SOn1]|uniref:o-succinylbenzoate synthase n=2 Tax=Vibrio nigripulchritudo TaxID=28173 RepID=A0AAV2VVJ3_9VIBR|nr:o-succinylbenzoate synthase [Vibrio nigripulchritudo SOn1]
MRSMKSADQTSTNSLVTLRQNAHRPGIRLLNLKDESVPGKRTGHMRNVKLYRYQLAMDSGVILRDQKLPQRDGWIIELKEGENTGFGEVAPLPGFSKESFEDAGEQLQEQLAKWAAGEELHLDTLHPSVSFGLSIAQMELVGGLPENGNYSVAPLCTGDPDDLLPVLSQLNGEKVAKIKVGLYEPIRDGMLVNLFLESIPDLSLRLDANRAWSPDEARKFASYINPSYRQRIAFLEEPCKQPGESLAFAIDTGIAIAWDETLQHAVKQEGFALSELTGVKSLVIKPSLIGSIERCAALVKQAEKLGITSVISSSLESSLGLNQLARLAHWLTPKSVPGLDTLGMFASQLEVPWPGSPLPIESLESQELVFQC